MLFIIITGIIFFILLTIAVNKNLSTELDGKILAWFDSLENTSLESFFTFITWLGSLWVLIPVSLTIAIGLLLIGYHMPALVFALGFAGAVATTHLLKALLGRSRPELFEIIGDMPHDSSFPSAHTTQAFAFALMLSLLVYMLDIPFKSSLASLFIFTAIMVALSRLYLQVHFPSDVLAGILVASIWASLMIYLFEFVS